MFTKYKNKKGVATMGKSKKYLYSTIILISLCITTNVSALGVTNNISDTLKKYTLSDSIFFENKNDDVNIQFNKPNTSSDTFIGLHKINNQWTLTGKKEINTTKGSNFMFNYSVNFETDPSKSVIETIKSALDTDNDEDSDVYNYVDSDSDSDGLTDYQEIHKYFSDPYSNDTDGDGILDNDLNERTENTYVIKTTMRIKKPYNSDVMKNDNYQDAKLVGETSDYGIFNITLYPYNTNDVDSNFNWKEYAESSELQQYLKPTITANWDNELRTTIISDLNHQGIDIENSMYNGAKITDKQIVEKVSNYILNNTQTLEEFTIYYASFPYGEPIIEAELEDAFQSGKGNQYWSMQQQFDHELYGKQMYMNKQHGSCTSSAVLWETVFRAIGIPCRIVQTIPIIDSNDSSQIDLLSNISDTDILAKVRKGTTGIGEFASHTYNEVYVGNRWVRLNYNKINQNIIDENYFGAMIHYNTINDISDTDLTVWGKRYGLGLKDSFSYGNPYETTSISSVNGIHSKVVIK
ncbi:MAG: hypothetical protein ACI8WT_000731 [Clostridium sp.]